MNESGAAADGITITRVFDAPRELVFQAWTDPARFAHWFGGPDADVPVDGVAMDVRPGAHLPPEGYERAKAGWGVFFDAMAEQLTT